MRGIYAIPPIAFNEDLSVDYDGVKNTVQFCLDCGSHGVVLPVNASEFFLLNEEERNRVVKIAVETVDKKVPVVAGITAPSTQQAIAYAKYAQDVGADAVVAMPPYVFKLPENEIYRFFAELNDAVDIPIILQNFGPPTGTVMSVSLMLKMLGDFENVQYVKEETTYSPQVITKIIEGSKKLPDGALKGVMGGKGSRLIIEETMRGACGNMPSCHVADILVDIWELLEENKLDEAQELFNLVLPLLNYDGVYPITVYKEVLRRRGIIKYAAARNASWGTLDTDNHKELDRLWGPVSELFRVR